MLPYIRLIVDNGFPLISKWRVSVPYTMCIPD